MKPRFVGVLGLEEFYNSLYPFYCTSQYSIINHGFSLYCRTEKGENRLQKMQPVRMPTSFSSTPVMSNDRKFCEPKWKQRTADTHQQHLEQLQSPSGQETKILLFGSSMMERFHTTGERYKTKYFDPRHVTIAGVGGDGIQHMLYRLDNGLLEACPPSLSLFVFQAGTNILRRKSYYLLCSNKDKVFLRTALSFFLLYKFTMLFCVIERLDSENFLIALG